MSQTFPQKNGCAFLILEFIFGLERKRECHLQNKHSIFSLYVKVIKL